MLFLIFRGLRSSLLMQCLHFSGLRYFIKRVV
uniref:Uncharacterized protein n=1 Tax=Arundo donax TaxID=35708 RepID=A0A0A9FCP4_ARUDO